MTQRARELLKERQDARDAYQRDLVDKRIEQAYGSEANWLEALAESDDWRMGFGGPPLSREEFLQQFRVSEESDVPEEDEAIRPLDVPEEDRASDLRLGLEGEDRRLGLQPEGQGLAEGPGLLRGLAFGPGPNQPETSGLLRGQALGPGPNQPETSDVLRGQAFGPSERIMAEAQALERGLGTGAEPSSAYEQQVAPTGFNPPPPLPPPAAAPAAAPAAPAAAQPAAAQVDAARLQYQRDSLAPDPKEDPIGAIAFVLESMSKGYAGKELPITRLKKERIAQETHELNQMTTGLDMQIKVLEQTKGLPLEQRIQAIEKFGARMERIMPGWTASAVAMAQRETGFNSAIYPGIAKVLFAPGGDCHSTLGTGGAQACFNRVIDNDDHREKALLVYAKTQRARIKDTIGQLVVKISETPEGKIAFEQIGKVFPKGFPLSDFKRLLGRHMDAEDMSIIESNPELFDLFDDSEFVDIGKRATAVRRMLTNVAPGLRPIVEHILGLDFAEKDQLFRLLDAVTEHEKNGTINTREGKRVLASFQSTLNRHQTEPRWSLGIENDRVVMRSLDGAADGATRAVGADLTPQVREQLVSQVDYLRGLVGSIDGMLARMETHPGEFGIVGGLKSITQNILAGTEEIAGLGAGLLTRRDPETEKRHAVRSHGLGSALLGDTMSGRWLEAITEGGYFNPNIPRIKIWEGNMAIALAKLRIGGGDVPIRAITRSLKKAEADVNISGSTTYKGAKARLEAIKPLFVEALADLNRRLTGQEGGEDADKLSRARDILQPVVPGAAATGRN